MQIISYQGRFDYEMSADINRLIKKYIVGFTSDYTQLTDLQVSTLWHVQYKKVVEAAIVRDNKLLVRWEGTKGECYIDVDISLPGFRKGVSIWESNSDKERIPKVLDACNYPIQNGYLIVGIEHRDRPDCFILALHNPTVEEE